MIRLRVRRGERLRRDEDGVSTTDYTDDTDRGLGAWGSGRWQGFVALTAGQFANCPITTRGQERVAVGVLPVAGA